MRYDMFFPLDSQVARIFCPKKRLTTLMVVTCVTHGWIFVQAKVGQLVAFLKMIVGHKSTQALYLLPGWGSMFGSGL